jgi:hypothetical protein
MKCYNCKSNGVEMLQEDEYACKNCRTHFKLTKISNEELNEWFI